MIADRRAAPEIATFVVNLDSRPDRLVTVGRRLRRAGLPFERLSAVTPDQVAERGVRRASPGLAPGELACIASHLEIYDRVLHRGLPVALILEDDVVLSRSFVRQLRWTLVQLPTDWMICQLGWLSTEPLAHRTLSAAGRAILGPLHPRANRLFAGTFRLGTHAYLVTPAFARYALEHFVVASAPLDLMIRDHTACPPLVHRSFVHLPSVAGQDTSESDLDQSPWRRGVVLDVPAGATSDVART